MKLLGTFTTSVEKAFDEIDSDWRQYPGLVICGSHSPQQLDIENLLGEIEEARLTGLPFLGICMGHQLAAIEYARNVLGIEDATSEEFGVEGTFVVSQRERLKVGLGEDGESYWNNYEVSPNLLEEWDKPLCFITSQFHPEYQSSKDKPHPLLVKFLTICKKQ